VRNWKMLHLYLSRATELGIADSGHLNGGGSVAAAIIMKTFPDSFWSRLSFYSQFDASGR